MLVNIDIILNLFLIHCSEYIFTVCSEIVVYSPDDPIVSLIDSLRSRAW